MDIVTRKEAKERGLAQYFTGKPCPHGHVAERWAGTSRCVECDRKYREANPEKIRERQRKYREANREEIREASRKYRQGGRVEKAKRKRACRPEQAAPFARSFLWPVVSSDQPSSL